MFRVVLDTISKIEVIDQIPIGQNVLKQAQQLANQTGQTVFVGVKAFPRHVDPPPGAPRDMAKILDWILQPLGMFIPTGEYIISTEREPLLKMDCGGIVWIRPNLRPN